MAEQKDFYRVYTIREAIQALRDIANKLPTGYDSVFTTGVFEGNYTHQMHQFFVDKETNSAFIGYEMHEGGD